MRVIVINNFAEISLADTRVLRWLRKLSAGDPMIYYSGSLVEKSGNLIMLPRYTGEKKKTCCLFASTFEPKDSRNDSSVRFSHYRVRGKVLFPSPPLY